MGKLIATPFHIAVPSTAARHLPHHASTTVLSLCTLRGPARRASGTEQANYCRHTASGETTVYALTRLQADKRTWYWAVHFSRRGTLHFRRFYDPKYGGPTKSRNAAIAWRDEQLAKVPVLTKLEFCQQVRDNNTSGVPGVHFLVPPRQPTGIWQARLKLNGVGRTKSFSVQRHGHDFARTLAIRARQALLEAADDTPYLRDKVAIKKARTAV